MRFGDVKVGAVFVPAGGTRPFAKINDYRFFGLCNSRALDTDSTMIYPQDAEVIVIGNVVTVAKAASQAKKDCHEWLNSLDDDGELSYEVWRKEVCNA
jgi:hypothetical protein